MERAVGLHELYKSVMIVGFLLPEQAVAQANRAKLSLSDLRVRRCFVGPSGDGVAPDLAPVLAAAQYA